MPTSLELISRANDLNRKANAVAETILSELLHFRENNPDAVRKVLSSVAFRDLEIYESYRKQEDAALEEWLHS